MSKKKSNKKKGYKLRYATSHGKGIVVTLPYDPRKHVCEACGKSVEDGEIKTTALHHWRYAYRAETVRKDPWKALENTSEYCFYCHQIADGIRALLDVKPERAVLVLETLPQEKKEKMFVVIESMLELHKDNLREITNNPAVQKVFQALKKNG